MSKTHILANIVSKIWNRITYIENPVGRSFQIGREMNIRGVEVWSTHKS